MSADTSLFDGFEFMYTKELMAWLADEAKTLVYVCYRKPCDRAPSDTPYYVMVEGLGTMVCVPASHDATPIGALKKACKRWQERSEEKPFTR